MIEHHIDLPTPDGVMNTFITHPEEGGPFPVVIFYMDAPGKREELHDMARRIGTVGYYVVLPNLYYRTVHDFTLVRDEAGFKRMFELMNSLTVPLVMRDTAALLDYVERDPNAQAAVVGGVGYCMSGPYITAACGTYPERFTCGASVYGANMLSGDPNSAHLLADRIQGEMYFACAEIDRWAPKETMEQLESHFKKVGLNYRLEWYPGAEHGFAFPQRAGIYHKPSAERHWERLFALFERNLKKR